LETPIADWSSLTIRQRIKHLEIGGFVVFPQILPFDMLQSIRNELELLPTTAVDYSVHQRFYRNVQWTNSRNCIDLIALPEMLDFLMCLFGDEIVCTSCNYVISHPGHPGIALHTDAQPYGSKIFGNQASSPRLIRVLYYLDDLTPSNAPFRIIPHSHLSLHIDGNPYNRYESHPEEVEITCKAGSAILINQAVFHGNCANQSQGIRRMLAIGYRPDWAGPVYEVENWPQEEVSGLPPNVRPLFKNLNTRKIDYNVTNRPENMQKEAPGINPSRWDLE